jgi:hypothetical protein
MARHRLGNKEEATKWLSKANQSTGRALEEHNRQGGERLSWSRRVTLEVLRGEAESLILGDEGKQATNPP